jgi:hypothetical protein
MNFCECVCICVRLTDSHNAYPPVWINAPANERTMANYILENAKENCFSWIEYVCVWGEGGGGNSTIADMRAENQTVDYRTTM